MKKQLLLSTIVVVFISIGAMAQGTLQFNQVKLLSSTLETVPAGKVWKVEAIHGTVAGCYNFIDFIFNGYRPYSYATWAGMEVDGKKFDVIYAHNDYFANSNSTNCASDLSQYAGRDFRRDASSILPMWLPAGTTLKSHHADITLSVIEFNVVP